MDAIPVIRRTASERVDGTLVVKIEVEPMYRAEFNRLFPEVGMAAALAPLVKGIALPEPEPVEKPKVSHENSKWLALRCKEPVFWQFLNEQMPCKDNIDCEGKATTRVRYLCGVTSRAELDGDTPATGLFHRQIRIPFSTFMQGRQS